MIEAKKYALNVIEGKQIAGVFIRKACERFLSDLKREDVFFDEESANKPVEFFEKHLRHWEGIWSGKPIILEDWQKFILQQIFGWRKLDGRRRVRSVYIQIARKNAKTTLAAGIALYHLYMDTENSPQILVGANNEDQAKICTNTSGKIVRISPSLNWYVKEKHASIYEYKGQCISVVHNKRRGVIRAMSRDPRTKDGFNPSLGIIDEYHEAKDDDLLNVIESGQGARPEPLLFVITTAGFLKSGPCYSKLRRMSIDVLNGVSDDDSHLAFIYEQDKDDDWRNPELWYKSNPNLSISVFEDYLKDRMTKALNEGASKEVDFKTKNLNMWVDAPEVWIPDDIYIKNSHGIKEEELLGKTCYVGLDLSSGIDLNAAVFLFPEIQEGPHRQLFKGKYPFLSFFWIPEDFVRNNKINMDYSDWVREGNMFTTPGNVIDHTAISEFMHTQASKYNIEVIGFDARMAYHGTIQNLLNYDFDCQPFSQGIMSVTEPTKDLEKMIYAGEMEHFNNPVMRWMNGNITLRKDSIGNYMIDKGKSQGKIDGFASLINALGTYKRFPPKTSVYSKRGVMTI